MEFKKAPEAVSPVGEALAAAGGGVAALAARADQWVVALVGPELRLIVYLGLLAILFAALARAARWTLRRLRPRRCRWRRDRWRRNAALVRWQCLECGVDAFSSGRRPPRECKRDLREAAL